MSIGRSISGTVLNAETMELAWSRESREAALDRLMTAHGALVLRTALRVVRRYEDAQDASQEVFLRLYRHWGSVRPETVEAWLYRTTVNVCLDQLRRRGDEVALEVEPAAPVLSDDLDDAEKRRLLERALAHLTPRERAAIALCSIEGRTSAEAAEALGVSDGTVRSLLSTARGKLKEYVGRFWR
jgi:RNA polymerase sigma-70 factor (ECF subfamily)